MFLSTKGYAGDSGGTVVTCEDIHRAHVHTHVQDFQPNFYKPYGTFVPDFCIPSGKRKVAENWRNEVVWRSYGMQYLHTYSFNIKGFFCYHVRKLTNIQCTDVGNEFPV